MSYHAFKEAVIEIGDEGLFANLIKAVPLEPYAMKVVTVVLLSCFILYAIYDLGKKMFKAIERHEQA